jgi:hypothetical protein
MTTNAEFQTQSIARIIKQPCNRRAISRRVDGHNSLIYKQLPAYLWPARNDATEQRGQKQDALIKHKKELIEVSVASR